MERRSKGILQKQSWRKFASILAVVLLIESCVNSEIWRCNRSHQDANDQVHAAGAYDVDFKTDAAARSRATPSSSAYLPYGSILLERLYYDATRSVQLPQSFSRDRAICSFHVSDDSASFQIRSNSPAAIGFLSRPAFCLRLNRPMNIMPKSSHQCVRSYRTTTPFWWRLTCLATYWSSTSMKYVNPPQASEAKGMPYPFRVPEK